MALIAEKKRSKNSMRKTVISRGSGITTNGGGGPIDYRIMASQTSELRQSPRTRPGVPSGTVADIEKGRDDMFDSALELN